MGQIKDEPGRHSFETEQYVGRGQHDVHLPSPHNSNPSLPPSSNPSLPRARPFVPPTASKPCCSHWRSSAFLPRPWRRTPPGARLPGPLLRRLPRRGTPRVSNPVPSTVYTLANIRMPDTSIRSTPWSQSSTAMLRELAYPHPHPAHAHAHSELPLPTSLPHLCLPFVLPRPRPQPASTHTHRRAVRWRSPASPPTRWTSPK